MALSHKKGVVGTIKRGRGCDHRDEQAERGGSSEGRGGERGREEGRSCHRHLGRDRPLALRLRLVPLERLLSAALQILAVMVLRHTVLLYAGLAGAPHMYG